MRFALVNNEKVEARKGLKGLCPLCRNDVTAKCGNWRINHWAHKANYNCDSWWENETEWHRAWKNEYPKEWQEIALSAPTGEKHFADVHTDLKLTIEFQNSSISSEERATRELFYGQMIWVVNCNNRARDYARLIKAKAKDLIQTNVKGFHLTINPENCFPATWLDRKVPVAFDFSSDTSREAQAVSSEPLWYLLPERIEGCSVIVEFSYKAFVSATRTRPHLIPNQEIMNSIREWYKKDFAGHIDLSDILNKPNRSAECELKSDQAKRLIALRNFFIEGK